MDSELIITGAFPGAGLPACVIIPGLVAVIQDTEGNIIGLLKPE